MPDRLPERLAARPSGQPNRVRRDLVDRRDEGQKHTRRAARRAEDRGCLDLDRARPEQRSSYARGSWRIARQSRPHEFIADHASVDCPVPWRLWGQRPRLDGRRNLPTSVASGATRVILGTEWFPIPEDNGLSVNYVCYLAKASARRTIPCSSPSVIGSVAQAGLPS